MTLSRFFGRSILILMALIVLFPVVWTVLGAFKYNVDLLTPTPKVFFTPTLENFAYVLGRPSVLQALINSLIICGTSALMPLARRRDQLLCPPQTGPFGAGVFRYAFPAGRGAESDESE